ncbi:MAG: F0F1 ATP synthase subunit epsilon [Candidatus Riflebacteria bacterium]|nr:F0F1 ATP synthase subunit epsilon [Candidatus Riflebacteria bacterium]
MHLKILLPSRVFLETDNVLMVKIETSEGSVGMFPNRRDCAISLVPGLLTYETKDQGRINIAIDEGILVKAGPEVLISVRHAMEEKIAGGLRESLEREFKEIRDRDHDVKTALAKLESGFVRRLMDVLQRG